MARVRGLLGRRPELSHENPTRNPHCSEFEVDNWMLSRYVLERLVPIVGIQPFPLNELMLMAAAVCPRLPRRRPQPRRKAGRPAAGEPSRGSLSATGQRQSIPTESGRPAVTVQLSWPVSLTSGDGLSRGFRAEVLGFDDGAGLTVLRGVWTDDRGDRIFTRLNGETVASGRRIYGAITGGTGRYAGITGDYSFDWQYVVEAEAGTMSGRGIGLRGRYRVGEAGK